MPQNNTEQAASVSEEERRTSAPENTAASKRSQDASAPEEEQTTDTEGSEEEVDLPSLMNMRARTYGVLARLYRKEVDDDVLKELQGMRFPTATGNKKVDKGYRLLYDYLKGAWEDSVTELAVDYVRTFIGHGVNGYSAAYPYESVYTSEKRLMMQEARAEVLQTLRDNHLKRNQWNEGEDHIAIELEFMQRMSMRTAKALRDEREDDAITYLETQFRFANDHLMNWLPMLTKDMLMFAKTDFYKGLAYLTMGYVEEDVDILKELLDSVNDGEAE